MNWNGQLGNGAILLGAKDTTKGEDPATGWDYVWKPNNSSDPINIWRNTNLLKWTSKQITDELGETVNAEFDDIITSTGISS